jgi:Icc-related predicted phosphoesterase
MKIVCISDTHGLHNDMKHSIPDGDVLIHAGDLTNMGKRWEIAEVGAWLNSLPHKYKIVIAGNHDFALETNPANVKLLGEAIYLMDSSATIAGIKFYGAPWTPRFGPWAFMLPRDGQELTDKWAMIPTDADVVITHGPPHGVMDMAEPGLSVGCECLALAIARNDSLGGHTRKYVFGHIHEGYGDSPRYVNASICDERYAPINKPIAFELDTRHAK